MKIVNSLALALFAASAEAFGPAAPVGGSSFGASTSSSHQGDMMMRIGRADMGRRQKINKILRSNPTKEVVEQQLLSPINEDRLKRMNWKLRKATLRKIRNQAQRYQIDVDPDFGLAPTQAEREAMEQAKGVQNKKEKEALAKAVAEQMAEAKATRDAKKAANKAKAAAAESAKAAAQKAPKIEKTPEPVAETAPEPVAETAPEPVAEAAPEPVAEAAPAPPAEAAPAPAAAGGEITPKTIKALRDATGAGMMDCKKALIETDGDQEAAADFLRKKGLAKADKKASRVAAEGKIAFASGGNRAVMVEVNCETDFVGKDSSFLGYCDKVATAALEVSDGQIETLMNQEVDGETLEATRQALVAKIGENIQVRRLQSRGGEGSTVGVYVHMNRIGVMVELGGGDESLAQNIAMHVAAMNPPFATPDDVPAEVLEKEKKLLTEQALESGKPAEIVEKMVEGRIRKYLEEICLVSQVYVKDGDKTVGKLLEASGAKMIGFTRIEVGEGIEKKEDDFAAEVAKMAGVAA